MPFSEKQLLSASGWVQPVLPELNIATFAVWCEMWDVTIFRSKVCKLISASSVKMKKTNVAKRKLTTVFSHHPCIVPTCDYVGEFRSHKSHYKTNLRADDEGNLLPLDHTLVQNLPRKKIQHQQFFLANNFSLKNLPKLPTPDSNPKQRKLSFFSPE